MRPDFARGPVFRHFLKQIAVGVEEETQARGEFIHVHAGALDPLHVFNSVAQGEGQLLHGRRARFANVVTADGDGIPTRNLARPKGDGINNQAHGRSGRVNVLLLRDVFFQDVVLRGTGNLLPVRAIFLRDHQVHRPNDGRGRIDGHGGGHLLKGQARQQGFHIREGRNRHAAPSHFTFGQRMVAVVSHQRGQVEGDGKARLALLQQIVQALVGVLGATKSGKLTHRPNLAAIHHGVNATRVGILARVGQVVGVVEFGKVRRGIKLVDGHTRKGGEFLLPLR